MIRGVQKNLLMICGIAGIALICDVPARAFDWDPISQAEKSLSVNPIDPGAGAIVLFKRGDIRVETNTKIVTYVRIKILTEAGREHANVSFAARKGLRLSKIEGRTILPSSGIVPLDSSQVHRGRIYESARGAAIIKTSFALPAVEPGAIIEYRMEQNQDGWYRFDPWVFDEPGLATLRSTLKVLVAPPLALAQFPVESTRTKINARESRTVQGDNLDYVVENLAPVRPEPYALPFRNQAAMVIFTPYQLGYGPGSTPLIKKWDDVAEGMNREYRDAISKSKEAKKKAREIAGNISDQRARAEALYRFVQRNVAPSGLLGVGLDRTVDEVLAAKQGDQSEINALYVTMVREVNVDADLVLIAARNWQTLVGEFPNLSQFSHVITRLNLKEGISAVDAADPGAPFGELPWFETGILGIVVKGNKSQAIGIPVNALEENLTETKLSSELKPGWKVESELAIAMKGAAAMEMRRDMQEEAAETLGQRLTNFLGKGLPDALVADVAHPDFNDSSQPLSLKAHMQYQITEEGGSGRRLLNPWVADRYASPLFKATERYSAVAFEFPEKRTCTSTWRLPAGVTAEQLPTEVRLADELGDFSHSCAQQADVVTCTRNLSLKKLLLQGMDEYRAAKKFFEDIARYDQDVMVLREK
jgi:hypothetical protein